MSSQFYNRSSVILLFKFFFCAFSSLFLAVKAQYGTGGRTDGEPGDSIEGHCCGMKGLGGAWVNILCFPEQVARNQPFNVNVEWKTDVKRPIDVHVDVLDATTKQFYAGETKKFEEIAGQATFTLTLPPDAKEPFLWKVFVTPRDEPFPNMLAESGMNIGLGNNVQGNCPIIKTQSWDPAFVPVVNSLMMTNKPKMLNAIPGRTYPIQVKYALMSEPQATITASFMYKGTNTLISSEGITAKYGQHKAVIDLELPVNVRSEPIYIVTTMTPIGKTWNDRLAEDRSYNVGLGGARGGRMNAYVSLPEANTQVNVFENLPSDGNDLIYEIRSNNADETTPLLRSAEGKKENKSGNDVPMPYNQMQRQEGFVWEDLYDNYYNLSLNPVEEAHDNN